MNNSACDKRKLPLETHIRLVMPGVMDVGHSRAFYEAPGFRIAS